ncbi:hypothetical protein [Miltoncostaea oceani]|uniref:hypothetical protein n=1 Tax=Miltoncostaea oceani TaxID=2843216 RepID=UPI001C3D0115|nr:hypothetical protein [Miltoncostaea oceani]
MSTFSRRPRAQQRLIHELAIAPDRLAAQLTTAISVRYGYRVQARRTTQAIRDLEEDGILVAAAAPHSSQVAYSLSPSLPPEVVAAERREALRLARLARSEIMLRIRTSLTLINSLDEHLEGIHSRALTTPCPSLQSDEALSQSAVIHTRNIWIIRNAAYRLALFDSLPGAALVLSDDAA